MGFGLIKALRPRAAFLNSDKVLTGLGGPSTDLPLINADVYYHEAHFPVSSARLLGTFQLDEPIYFKLALDQDTDVAIRSIGRNARGLRTAASVAEAEPSIKIVKALAGGSGNGGPLQNQHVALLPTRPVLNSELPFIQFRDEGDVSARSQIRSRRTPTGAQNAVTDWNCSGDGRVYQVIYTAGSKDIQIIPGAWFDDLTIHPVPYWVEGTTHTFRGGQGVRIFGPAPGAPPTYTTVTGVNGNTITVADALTYSANPGALAHDDYATLQAAINNRGHLWIPEGRYWCRQRLLWPSTATGLNQQVIIEGDGEWRSVIVFNHDGNGLQLDGPLQTGNPNSGVYDAVIRNLGLWCVPDDSKEGIRATNMGHGLAFTATNRNPDGVPGPSTGNVRVENVLLQGWGRWGLWSDNLQSAFLVNIKGYHNRSGAIALVGNATRRGTSQQEDNSIEITNSLVVYSGPQDFGGGAAAAKTLSGGSISVGAPRTLTVAGGLTAADVGCIIKLVNGPGVDATTHVTMIESVQSSTACTISMPVFQGFSGFQVIIYQTCVANIFLHNANNVRITGGTHQGNWVGYSGDAGGVRAEHLDALRIDGLWEEDAGGEGGAAIDLYDCRAVSIDSTHTGGSIDVDPPITPAGHGVGIRITDCQGVKVRGTYIGQSGAGTAYQTHGNTQGVEFDNCYGADWIAGLANTDVAGEPVIIGPGCHALSFDNAQTSTLALWDEQWTNIVGNPNFLEGMVGWTTPTAGVVTQPGYPYAFLPSRWDRYVVVNTQALGAGQVDVLTQDIALPDSRQSGQWVLGWDHYIESRGAGGATDNNTVVTIEVRTATSGYTVRSITLTADAGYGLPVGRWMRLCIKTNLDGGVAGRFFRIRFSNQGTANSPIFRVSNFRLQPGISSTFDFDQPITQERGGPLYAPLYFKELNPTQFPPPPPPANAISVVNIGGVLKRGQGGVYADIGGGTVGPGTPNKLAMFGPTPGTTVVDGPAIATPSELVVIGVGLRVENNKAIDTLYSTTQYCPLATCGSDDVVRFGPLNDTAGGSAGSIVLLRAGGGVGSQGQFWNNGVTGCLTYNAALDQNDASKSWGASGLHLATVGITPAQNGITIHATPNTGYTGNYIQCLSGNLHLSTFVVDKDGNLAVIRRKEYSWPSGTIPPIDATHPVKVLGYTDAGPPVQLNWIDPPGGTSTGVIITGAANRFAIFNTTGDNVTNGPAIATPSELVTIAVGVRVENTRAFNTLYSTASYCDLAQCDASNVVKFGPTNDTVGGSAGCLVLLQSGAGVGPRGQLWNDGANGGLTYNADSSVNSSGNSWGASSLHLATIGAATAQHGLTIHATPNTGYTGNLIQCLTTNLHLPKFVVGPDGDLDVIKGKAYTWPTTTWNVVGGVLTTDGAGNLQWVLPTGSVITGLTNYRVPRWNSATPALVDSAISDTTSVDGIVNTACLNFTLARTGGLDLSSDLFLRTGINNDAIWRYEHRSNAAGGTRFAANDADGEMQLFLHSNLDSTHSNNPFVAFGTVHSWFQTTLRVRPYFYSGAGNSIEVWSPTTSIPYFAVAQDGNLAIIRQVTYAWPFDHPASSTPASFLRCDASGNLTWEAPATGGGNVSSTTPQTPNFLTRWGAAANTIKDAGIRDDDGNIWIENRGFIIHNPSIDSADFTLQGSSSSLGMIRYQHTTGNLSDSGNAGTVGTPNIGEIQFFLNQTGGPNVSLGAVRSWFQGGVRIRPTPGLAASVGNALEIRTSGDAPAFYIDQGGNIVRIAGVPYTTWPNALPTGTAKFLQCDTAGALTWQPAGGTGSGTVGPGTIGTIALFVTNTTTVGNSQLTQDGAKVYVNSRDLLVIGDAAVADLAQIGLQASPSNTYGIWRFEHRSIGLYDTINTAGEMQLRVNADVTHIALGAKRAYFTAALRVRYPDTSDYPIAVCTPGGALTNLCFRVDTDGGLGIIRSVNYTWPAGPLTYPTGGAYKFLGFSTTSGTPQLGWFDAPAASGGGANVFLSNLSESTPGDHTTSGVAINTWVLPGTNADGTAGNAINLGSPSKKFNAAYFYSGAFVYPINSTDTGPRAFGFIPTGAAYSTAEATRFLIYGDRNCFQSGDKVRTQVVSYLGIELVGNRRDGAALGYTRQLVATNEDTAVVIASPNDSIGLYVNLISGNTRDPIRCGVGGGLVFRVSSLGDLTIHSVSMLWPNAVAAANGYVLSMSNIATGQLQWIAPPTGGSGVTWNSGSAGPLANFLTKWTPGSAPYTIQNSSISDSGIQVICANPFKVSISSVDKFKVNNQGSVVGSGGTQFKAKELQLAANSTTAISTDWRTVIVDTVFGPQNVTLPSAQANPGMIIEIIHLRAVQSILAPITTGYDQLIQVMTTGSDVFNGWGGGQPQATVFKLSYPGFNGIGTGSPPTDNQHKMIKLIADETLAIWWLMPYYL